MITGDFMTELELLFYVSWGLYAANYFKDDTMVNWTDTQLYLMCFFVVTFLTLVLGIFHQILKTICFRIPWYEWFFG